MATVHLRREEVQARQLPPLCLRCGAMAEVYTARKFGWYPAWVGVLAVVGFVAFGALLTLEARNLPWSLIILLVFCLPANVEVFTRRLTVHAPLCDEHLGHWKWGDAVRWAGL